MIRRLPSLLAIAAACAACAGAPRPAPPARAPAPAPAEMRARPAPPRTGLQLVVAPPDALVDIDGVPRGRASALGAETGGVVGLAPGVHRVSVRRDGFETWRAEVSVGAAVERIDVRLVEQR